MGHTVSTKLGLLTKTAMFAAIITVVTGYILHIPLGNGYIHLGDTFIYLAACLLPTPYAMVAAALGAALADGLTGAAIWMVPTLIIKALMVLPFTAKGTKLLTKRNVIAVLASGLICCVGYGIAQAILFQTWAGLFFPNPWIQSGACAAVFFVVAYAMDKSGVKAHLMKGSLTPS